MAFVEASRRFLGGPRMGVAALWKEAMAFAGSLWAVAFLFGLMIGWVWKPRWVVSRGDKLASCVSEFLCSSLPSSPTSRQLMSPLNGFASAPCFNSFTLRSPNCDHPSLVDNHRDSKPPPSLSPIEYHHCSASRLNEEQFNIASLLTREDLEYLYQLVEVKDGGPTWIQMMDRSTPTMSYQAWRRDPKGGPPQYRTRTVFEDASPEVVRDFFWDDEFRPKWDDMLAYSATLDECPTTGTMIVHWIRKFPFFCSDREYIIGRRIWESGRSYYCVTKGVPGASIPRRNKPRRVDLYYSSWCIRAVECRRGDGQLTACEVMFFHYEDMGIPWEIAKLGVRQGMWGTVKKIEPGLRAYQKGRASGAALSRPAFLAQINTKISPGLLISLGGVSDSLETEAGNTSKRPAGMNIPKILIIGGAIVLACSIEQGLLTKTFIFGVARKFANMGKRT